MQLPTEGCRIHPQPARTNVFHERKAGHEGMNPPTKEWKSPTNEWKSPTNEWDSLIPRTNVVVTLVHERMVGHLTLVHERMVGHLTLVHE